MGITNERVIGAFLYAASPDNNYTVFKLIFTSTRVLALSRGMLGNVPYSGNEAPDKDDIQTRRWSYIKSQIVERAPISFNESLPEQALEMGLLNNNPSEINEMPYTALNKITIREHKETDDLEIKFHLGFLNSHAFLMDRSSLPHFTELVKKTPISEKLVVFGK